MQKKNERWITEKESSATAAASAFLSFFHFPAHHREEKRALMTLNIGTH